MDELREQFKAENEEKNRLLAELETVKMKISQRRVLLDIASYNSEDTVTFLVSTGKKFKSSKSSSSKSFTLEIEAGTSFEEFTIIIQGRSKKKISTIIAFDSESDPVLIASNRDFEVLIEEHFDLIANDMRSRTEKIHIRCVYTLSPQEIIGGLSEQQLVSKIKRETQLIKVQKDKKLPFFYFEIDKRYLHFDHLYGMLTEIYGGKYQTTYFRDSDKDLIEFDSQVFDYFIFDIQRKKTNGRKKKGVFIMA